MDSKCSIIETFLETTMKLNYRLGIFLVLTAVLMLAVSVSAVAAQDDPLVIHYWSHDSTPRIPIDNDMIAMFEADNPGVTVEYTVGPGDDPLYVEQLLTALAGGEGPDCFNVVATRVPELVPSGAVVPVDFRAMGYESQQELMDVYIPGTLNTFISDDTLYAVPTEVGNYSLFINGDLFEAAGLDPVEDAPETWEELMELAPQLTIRDANGNITQRAFDFAYPIPDEIVSPRVTFGGMAYQLGGTYFNEDFTAGNVNHPGWVRTFEFIRDYAKEFGGPAMTPSSIGFYEGNVAMVVSGAWYLPYAQENNPDLTDNIVAAPLPRFEDAINDTGSMIFAYGIYTSSQASPEVQEACWKLVSYLTSKEAADRYLTDVLTLQPRVDLASDEELLEGNFIQTFIDDMAGNPFLPAVAGGGELPGILNRALDRVMLEDMDAQESLDLANEEINEFLSANTSS
jgi:multiple sugar transport system substrate-binding protein